ncbi:YhcH/YjgK/YiaL family protein [Diplocloster modestus]|uniref:YhcH/YjgK/YiaL family protein n=1 Tax=Diplocloster modestus TaxID=2850322 RepID=A0ABS6K6N5_9FIRM|nr:YhcH/YjgK/YiaL family protein [Diplocloster modestus]MBU9726157.1 YhcH/YjgK/YiaL family protein [Diplocloster modestus]
MIIDKIEHLREYALTKRQCGLIRDFIREAGLNMPPEGRYELDGDKLFALVQCYETREKSVGKMESHKAHLDLQYMMDGEELVYLNFSDELQVMEDQTPKEDFVFYRTPDESIGAKLKTGMFMLMYPWDAHLPCCQINGTSPVKKIVFKIRLDETE